MFGLKTLTVYIAKANYMAQSVTTKSIPCVQVENTHVPQLKFYNSHASHTSEYVVKMCNS